LKSRYITLSFLLIGVLHARDYNQEFWKNIALEIDNGTYKTDSFLYADTPDISICKAGEITTEAKSRAMEVVNETRKLHNLSAVSYSYIYDIQAQNAALIQVANNYLSHYPQSTDLCYSADGYSGSNTGNIGLMSFTPDPAYSVIGWSDDASNVSNLATVGHRRWIIDPFLEYVSYGQVAGAMALKVNSFDQEPNMTPYVGVDFVAFPYEEYPYLFFSDKTLGKPTPWSFSIVEDKTQKWGNQYDYFSNASVNVVERETKKRLNVRTIENQTRSTISELYNDSNGYGLPNIITWQVDDWVYDTWYTVTISNVKMQSGESKDYSYDVYIDYGAIFSLNADLEEGDRISGTQMSGFITGDDKDGYSVTLNGSTTIVGTSSVYAGTPYYIALYDSKKNLITYNNGTINMDLEGGEYTIVVSNYTPDGTQYYQSNKNYTVTYTTQPYTASSSSSSISSSSSSKVSSSSSSSSSTALPGVTSYESFLSGKTFSVSGIFGSYDFSDGYAEGASAFDWAFAAGDVVFQLQGNAPSDSNVFGWKQVAITPPKAAWYMFATGEDIDSDGSAKFDWILVSPDFSMALKLEGVNAEGTFEYSTPLSIEYTISNDGKEVTFY